MPFSLTRISRGATLLAFLSALMLTAALPALAQTETVLYSFCSVKNCADGAEPLAGLIQDAKGDFYSTTVAGGTYGWGTVFELKTDGTEAVLHSFANNGTDGYSSYAGLVRKGAFYGTTNLGGEYGYGTVFRLTANGTEKILHNFARNGTDGNYSVAGLLMDKKGNLYGTTSSGGAYSGGTVFELSSNGTETVLHSFAQNGTDGYYPYAGLLMDKNGNLYGTTTEGGAHGGGAVFELNPADGNETILYSFGANATDGSGPTAGLIMDENGNLYGTTSGGGANKSCDSGRGCGTVFKLSPDGTETILHSFGATASDGYDPYCVLLMDKKGNLYGTTPLGGANGTCNGGFGCGTVFELSPNGTETILHNFGGSATDGNTPWDGLVMDKNGNLYGTTGAGGAFGGGTVFKVTPQGRFG